MTGCSLFIRIALPTIFLFASDALHAGLWTQKADLGGNRRVQAAGFSIGNKGYIGTGFGCDSITCWDHNDFWEYDPLTNTWSQKADFGGSGRSKAVGFSVGNKGYIGVGRLCSDLWEYDPSSNTWMQKASFPAGNREKGVGFGIGNKGYVGLGFNGSTYHIDLWEYDPVADTWTQKSNMTTPREAAVAFVIGNKGYVGTGCSPSYKKDFWEFDPVANTWTQKADVGLYGLSNAIGFSLGTKGFIVTGSGWGSKVFWEWDQASNTWTQQPDFPGDGRGEAVGFSIGTKGYMGTGYDQHFNKLKDFWEYDPNAFASVQENEYMITASVYPNPFNSSSMLTLEKEVKGAVLLVYDAQGKEVRKIPFTGITLSLHKEDLNSGIYFFKITSGNKLVSGGRFIIL